jgi:hypothetical protein
MRGMVSDGKITGAGQSEALVISRAGGVSPLFLSVSGGGLLQSAHRTMECGFREG